MHLLQQNRQPIPGAAEADCIFTAGLDVKPRNLPVRSQSRFLVGLNTHFHLLPSSRALVPQENEKTPFTNYFINTEMKAPRLPNEMK